MDSKHDQGRTGHGCAKYGYYRGFKKDIKQIKTENGIQRKGRDRAENEVGKMGLYIWIIG